MAKKLPAFQFYPGDWMKDPALRRCTHAAKGVLIDVLCLMFESPERGVLTTDGKPWSDDEIALAVGGHVDVTLLSLRELLDKGVLRRRNDGAIFSSRMVRDEQERQKARKRKQKSRKSVTSGACHDASHADVTDDVTPLSHRSSSSSSSSVNNTPPSRAREVVAEAHGNPHRPRQQWVPYPDWMPGNLQVAFTDWRHHLAEKEVNPTRIQQLNWYTDCQRHGVDQAIETIRFSVSKGAKSLLWDGPFQRGASSQQHPPARLESQRVTKNPLL